MYIGYVVVCVVVVSVVLNRGEASTGESFTLECSSNNPFTLIYWYRNNNRVASTERYSSGECGVINTVKYIKFTVGRCDQHVHQLIINNVSYTEDNGAHWSCSDDTTTNSFILSVVKPTATTANTDIETTSTTATTEPTASTANTSSPVNIDTTATTANTLYPVNIETTATIETTSFTATSQYTETTDVTVPTLTDNEHKRAKQDTSEQTIVIIAGSVGAVVLIIVVAVVVIIVIYKHRQKSAATREPIMTENDLHVSAGPGVDGADKVTVNQSQRQTKFPEYAKVSETNKPDQPSTEPIIMENDLYTSADQPHTAPIIMENDIYTSADQPHTAPIIMENDLYTSADQCQADCSGIYTDQTGNAHFNSSVTKPGDNNGPVYSLVNKTKKPVPTPDNTNGPVYSLVNTTKKPVPIPGDKDGPVYSIVNKHMT